jgi:hypothetical protein
MRIWDTTNSQAVNLHIDYDGPEDITADVLEAVGISSPTSGITRVDGHTSGFVSHVAVDDTAARDAMQADCSRYGTSEDIGWWVDYVEGCNATEQEGNSIRQRVNWVDNDDNLDALLTSYGLPRYGGYGDMLADYITNVVGTSTDFEAHRALQSDAYNEIDRELIELGY